jgi:hypothetical protein
MPRAVRKGDSFYVNCPGKTIANEYRYQLSAISPKALGAVPRRRGKQLTFEDVGLSTRAGRDMRRREHLVIKVLYRTLVLIITPKTRNARGK